MMFFKKLATHTFYQLIARIASSGASFLITIIVARHFGVASYGDFAKVTAFVTMFYLLADFGFNAIFLQKDTAEKRFRDLFYLRCFLAIVLIGIVNIVAFFLPYNSITGIGFSPFVRAAIALFSITIFTEAILYSAFAIFQKKYIYKRFALATIIGSITTLGLVGIFILAGLPLLYVFVAYVIGGVLEALASIVLAEERLFPVEVHEEFLKGLFYQTLPVAFMLIFNLIYFRIDTFLLSLFRPSQDVGIYDISYRVFDFLLALPLFLSNVLYPKLIEEEKNKRRGITNTLLYTLRFGTIGALVALPFWFLAPVIFILIKPQLLPAVSPLRILLLSLPIFFATNILQWILLSKKKQVYLSFVYGFLTIGNIISNLVFIPSYGYIASAIITGIGEACVLVLLLWKVYKEI